MSIRVRNYTEVVDYCTEHISPRRYYLHNQIGGLGWRVIRKDKYWELEIHDEKSIDAHITWLALTSVL
jgi:hypothetical protein